MPFTGTIRGLSVRTDLLEAEDTALSMRGLIFRAPCGQTVMQRIPEYRVSDRLQPHPSAHACLPSHRMTHMLPTARFD